MPGIRFDMQTGSIDLPFNVDISTGQPEARETYYYTTVQSNSEASKSWVPVSLPWNSFVGVDWEAHAGLPFDRPNQVLGISFSFNAPEDASLTGTLWIDHLGLEDWVDEGGQEEPGATALVKQEPAASESESTEQPSPPNGLPCPSAAILLVCVFGVMVWRSAAF